MPELKGLEQLINSGSIKKGDDSELEIKRLPLGVPTLDTFLGGGLPLGRCTLTYGPESTGKTLFAQLVTAAVQRSQHSGVLYIDMERSYDKPWWQASGVDTENLMVSQPVHAEAALDVMRGVLNSAEDLGLIILDSIAAMTPKVETDMEKSSEEKTIGVLARVCTLMFHQIIPMLNNKVIFLATNQMRSSISAYSNELDALPGGWAQRHYSHIILRTRRDSWINDPSGNSHLGFNLELINRKNKVARIADGDSIQLPFMYDSQIDYSLIYIQEAIDARVIVRAGPYYKFAGRSFLGMPKLREFFADNPEEVLNMVQATQVATTS